MTRKSKATIGLDVYFKLRKKVPTQKITPRAFFLNILKDIEDNNLSFFILKIIKKICALCFNHSHCLFFL